MTQGKFFVWVMDAVRYGMHPVPAEVTELELMDLYHCGPWDLDRVDFVKAGKHLFLSEMLAKIRSMK